MLFLDNIETKQMTEGLINFLLTSSTGITKKKRKGGTDTDTVTERANCFVNTTGIDPLNGDMSAILSRSFVFSFDSKYHKNGLNEVRLIEEIKKNRDYILFGLFQKTAKVLDFIQKGEAGEIKKLLTSDFGKHSKQRCNDYLSLMYLMDFERNLELIKTENSFNKQVKEQIHKDRKISINSSQIANGLSTLFRARDVAIQSDKVLEKQADTAKYLIEFKEKNKADFFNTEGKIDNVLAKDLFLTLLNITKNSATRFNYSMLKNSIN